MFGADYRVLGLCPVAGGQDGTRSAEVPAVLLGHRLAHRCVCRLTPSFSRSPLACPWGLGPGPWAEGWDTLQQAVSPSVLGTRAGLLAGKGSATGVD